MCGLRISWGRGEARRLGRRDWIVRSAIIFFISFVPYEYHIGEVFTSAKLQCSLIRRGIRALTQLFVQSMWPGWTEGDIQKEIVIGANVGKSPAGREERRTQGRGY